MKVFVWEYLDEVSGAYHSDGGLLVVAETLDAAVKLAETNPYVKVGDEQPTVVYETSPDAEERVMVFPNAGCC